MSVGTQSCLPRHRRGAKSKEPVLGPSKGLTILFILAGSLCNNSEEVCHGVMSLAIEPLQTKEVTVIIIKAIKDF